MDRKVRVYSEINAEGKRKWRHECQDCSRLTPQRNWFVYGGPWSRWEWAMEDAETHLMMYH